LSSWEKIARRIRVPTGFAFAAAYLYFARPSAWSLVWGGAVAIPGLLIRAVASAHVRKNERLATSGPYAHTRNPLYLGSLIIAFGFALASRNWWIGISIPLLFSAIYIPVISSEDRFLRERFPDYDQYARKVPRIWPQVRAEPGGLDDNNAGFSWDLYRKHREYKATLGAMAMLAALAVKLLWIVR
jgi:hypothetical protein